MNYFPILQELFESDTEIIFTGNCTIILRNFGDRIYYRICSQIGNI